MILGLFVGVVLLSAALAITWLSYMYQRRPDGVPQWPAPAPAPQRQRHDLEKELLPYRTGEYPTVEVEPFEPVAEPVEAAPVGPYRSRHAADEDLAEPDVKPWQVPALENEATPFFWSTGTYPVFNVDLSATNSWNRADLRALLDMDKEAAA